jgi:hypothetical protein
MRGCNRRLCAKTFDHFKRDTGGAARVTTVALFPAPGTMP